MFACMHVCIYVDVQADGAYMIKPTKFTKNKLVLGQPGKMRTPFVQDSFSFNDDI